ncbi:hypothetical protein HYV72_01900, partial [Candidatus Uhrbacteria bacterium]|nr:hypothetical protein [Candidatus Uhrbacteria bacterium]
MMKSLLRFTGGFLTLALLVSAVAPVDAQPSTSQWSALEVSSSSDTLELDRADLSHLGKATGQRVGEHVLIVLDEPPFGDATRTVMLVRGNSMRRIYNVPVEALDPARILKNNGRIVWIAPTENDARYDVFEIDLASASVVQPFDDLFIGVASRVNVFAGPSDTFFFERHGVKPLKNGFPSVEIVRAYAKQQSVTTINNIWRKTYETIEDISDDGRVVTRLVFENGDQELWYHEAGASRAIPESYTINGYVFGAQFAGKRVEFFRYQQLMQYDPALWQTTALEDRVVWEADILKQQERFLANNGTLFFISRNEQDGRDYVKRRKGGVTATIGSWDGVTFKLVDGTVQIGRGDTIANGLDVYSAVTGTQVAYERMQDVDEYRNARVTRMGDAYTWIYKGHSVLLGDYEKARLQDDRHVLATDAAGRAHLL